VGRVGVRGIVGHGRVQNFELRRGATIHSRTATYIHQLTNEYSGLCSSVIAIFLGFGTKEYSSVVFLCTEEYIKPRKIPCFPIV
jgi:hypothetical protein